MGCQVWNKTTWWVLDITWRRWSPTEVPKESVKDALKYRDHHHWQKQTTSSNMVQFLVPIYHDVKISLWVSIPCQFRSSDWEWGCGSTSSVSLVRLVSDVSEDDAWTVLLGNRLVNQTAKRGFCAQVFLVGQSLQTCDTFTSLFSCMLVAKGKWSLYLRCIQRWKATIIPGPISFPDPWRTHIQQQG